MGGNSIKMNGNVQMGFFDVVCVQSGWSTNKTIANHPDVAVRMFFLSLNDFLIGLRWEIKRIDDAFRINVNEPLPSVTFLATAT
jgi:hypothetical protein